jgi:hypothetical protein
VVADGEVAHPGGADADDAMDDGEVDAVGLVAAAGEGKGPSEEREGLHEFNAGVGKGMTFVPLELGFGVVIDGGVAAGDLDELTGGGRWELVDAEDEAVMLAAEGGVFDDLGEELIAR